MKHEYLPYYMYDIDEKCYVMVSSIVDSINHNKDHHMNHLAKTLLSSIIINKAI